MFLGCRKDIVFNCYELGMRRRQVDLRFLLGCADIARDVQVVVIGNDFLHRQLTTKGVPAAQSCQKQSGLGGA